MSDAWCDLCVEQGTDLYDVWDGKRTARLCQWCAEVVEMQQPPMWDDEEEAR